MMPHKPAMIVLDNDPRDYLVWRQGSGDTIEIYDIAVGTERGVGKGRRLVELLLHRVPADTTMVWAITRRSNRIAIDFYRAMGFKQLAKLVEFYGEKQDAVMYGRKVLQ